MHLAHFYQKAVLFIHPCNALQDLAFVMTGDGCLLISVYGTCIRGIDADLESGGLDGNVWNLVTHPAGTVILALAVAATLLHTIIGQWLDAATRRSLAMQVASESPQPPFYNVLLTHSCNGCWCVQRQSEGRLPGAGAARNFFGERYPAGIAGESF
eukprot:s8105_g4.t1